VARGRYRRIATLVALALSAPALGIAAVVVTASPAAAAGPTITVNTTIDDVTANNGLCSLREAITNSNNNSMAAFPECVIVGTPSNETILFNLTTPATLPVTQPSNFPQITRSVTIQGPSPGTPSAIVIDGGDAHQIFNAGTVNLTVSDLTIQHGNGVGGGGAIVGGNTIAATDVVFASNVSDNGGGAIDTAAGTVTVTNSTFSNDTASNTGGAIETGTSTLTITNTDFSNDIAQNMGGGAVHAGGTVTITGDSDFTNNTAFAAGGAAVLSAGAVTVNGTSDFTNNDSNNGSNGGAITANSVTISGGADFTNNDNAGGSGRGGCVNAATTITVNTGGNGSTFTNNTAAGGSGGCFFAETGPVTVTGATFTKNSSGIGGAIDSNGQVTATSSVFGGATVADGNTASGGGAIYTNSSGGVVSTTGSTFQHNTSGSSGGGAIISGGNFNATGSTFDHNSTGADGGAVLSGQSPTVSNSTFSANTASGNGGAALFQGGPGGSITNSTFEANGTTTAGSVGSALYLDMSAGALNLINITVADSTSINTAAGAVQVVTGVTMARSIVDNTTGGGKNCVGTFGASTGFNLESITGSTGSTCPTGGTNLADADPHLGALTVTAPGTTATMLPDPLLSPAVDAVASGCPPPATDQRGVNRPQGPACDIGAVELGDGLFSALVPARILDTRTPTGGHQAPLGPGASLNLHVVGHDGVPATRVSAVVMNVTAVGPTVGGWVTAWPAGVAEPNAASVNFDPGQTVGNLVTLKVGTGGNVTLANANGFVNLVADLVGFYGIAGDSRLAPLVPSRLLDTRTPAGGHQAPLGPGQSLDLQVTGQGGVPASGVTGVVMNVTAVGPTEGGWVTAWPAGVAEPNAASVNFDPGETIGNLVKLKLGTGGKVTLANANGFVNLVADVVGWFGPTGDSRVAPVVPARILDTRTPTGGHQAPLGPGAVFDMSVNGQGGVPPTGATAVVVNITAVGPTEGGWVTAWPTGATMPLASTINFAAGQTIGHLAVLKLGTGGKVSLFNANGFVNIVADVVGWYGNP
jgi:CSLREA domain-containing protein